MISTDSRSLRLGIGTFLYHVLFVCVWGIALMVIAGLAGCGRYGFCDGNVGADAGGGPNVVFVTSTTIPGVMAPNPLATADAFCASAAESAMLPGTFVAYLSTSSVNAIDRIGGSRGWVGTDGLPIIDQPGDLATGAMFNPIDHDQHGTLVAPTQSVWTGTGPDGHVFATCADWSDGNAPASFGFAGAGFPAFVQGSGSNCNNPASLYCFETGHVAPVAPVPSSAGRLAFLGHPRGGLDTTSSALDQICTTDAVANGLPGMYAAAIATNTSTVAQRFPMDGMPWRRVDGTIVATTAARLFDGTPHLSFINQTADGAYETNGGILVGTTNPFALGTNDCADWADTTVNAVVALGNAHFVDNTFWMISQDNCSVPYRVLCLQL
jgi:hypothetical protein